MIASLTQPIYLLSPQCRAISVPN